MAIGKVVLLIEYDPDETDHPELWNWSVLVDSPAVVLYNYKRQRWVNTQHKERSQHNAT